jgi:hypothetical protein
VVIVFFAIAVLSFLVRVSIRAFVHRYIATEDVFYILGGATLIGSFVTSFVTAAEAADVFNYKATGGSNPLLLGPIFDELPIEVSGLTALVCLNVATIWLIKFAYLFFFRKLISRIETLHAWWWCIVLIAVRYLA